MAVAADWAKYSGSQRQRKRETDPHIKVIDKFGELFKPTCCEVHLCPMGPDGREICIRLHYKGE